MKKIISVLLCALTALSYMGISANAKAIKVTAPKIKSVTNIDIDTQKIKWTKTYDAKGYQLYCKAGSGGFKKIRTFGKNTTSFTNKKLKIGIKYFYRIRAYRKVKSKTKYSKFSGQLGKKTTNYLVDLYTPFNTEDYVEEIKDGKTFYMGGEKYGNGLYFSYGDAFATYNLKGKYKNITMTVGVVDGNHYIDNLNPSFSIFSDDSCVANYETKSNSLPKAYKIDIQFANKLEIKVNQFYNYLGLANIKLYKK